MRNEYEKTVLRLLAGRDFIATEEVAGLIGASPATARRLINRLAENRLLRRVHGGIRPLPPESNPSIPFGLREQWFSEEKRLLAAEALKLVRRDSVLFIHGGSTTACLGSGIESGSVITNSASRNCCGSVFRPMTGRRSLFRAARSTAKPAS